MPVLRAPAALAGPGALADLHPVRAGAGQDPAGPERGVDGGRVGQERSLAPAAHEAAAAAAVEGAMRPRRLLLYRRCLGATRHGAIGTRSCLAAFTLCGIATAWLQRLPRTALGWGLATRVTCRRCARRILADRTLDLFWALLGPDMEPWHGCLPQETRFEAARRMADGRGGRGRP